jgi:ribosomal protein L29
MSDTKTTMDEIKKMNEKDRAKLLLDLQKESAKLAPLISTGKDKQNHKVNMLRKQIARIHTLNNSQKNAQ